MPKKNKKRTEKELLIEGCKEIAKESLKINKEFEAIEKDFDWEWNPTEIKEYLKRGKTK